MESSEQEGVLSDMGLGSAFLWLPFRSQLCHLYPIMIPAFSTLRRFCRDVESQWVGPFTLPLCKLRYINSLQDGISSLHPIPVVPSRHFPQVRPVPIWKVWGSVEQLITKFNCFLEFLECEREGSPGDLQRRKCQQCWVLWVTCYQGDFKEYLSQFLTSHIFRHYSDCQRGIWGCGQEPLLQGASHSGFRKLVAIA